MATSTKAKTPAKASTPEIDPDFLRGRAITALELLPDDPALLDITVELQGAFKRYRAIRDRIDAQIKRFEELDRGVQEADDETMRSELAAERAALAGELLHAPRDAEAAARRFSEALRAWARYVRPRARRVAEEAAKQARPIEAERWRVVQKTSPSLPTSAAPADPGALKEQAAKLLRDLAPHANRRDRALELERGALGELTTRFGDAYEGDISEAGVRRWCEGIRKLVTKETQAAQPQVSDALRPASI